MNLSWLRPKTATVEELSAQFDAAMRFRGERVAALRAAELAFDADGSSSSAAAVAKARDELALAGDHLRRARRLLDAARAARAAAERAELERALAELVSELSAPDAVDADLQADEARAWLAAVAVREQRLDHAARRAAQRREVDRLRVALGLPPVPVSMHADAPPTTGIADALREHLARLPMGQLRSFIFELCGFLDPASVRMVGYRAPTVMEARS